MTDGHTIYVDDRLSAAQLLCTIQHELIHIERGHSRKQQDHVEQDVRCETARRLLPVEAMEGQCQGDMDLGAKRLGVTKQVLMDRASTFTDADAYRVGCHECRACPAMRWRFAPAWDNSDMVGV